MVSINSQASNSSSVIIATPNPCQDKLIISGSTLSSSYEILDMKGISQIAGDINSESYSIDLEELPQGFYLVKVTDLAGGVSVLRFSKE